MPLQPYKRGPYYWVKGRVEYNGRPITRTYRRSTKASTEAGARDWITRETELQIRHHVIGDESIKTFSDAIKIYNASAKAAKQLILLVEEIGDHPISAISGSLLKSLGRKLKPMA